MFRNQTPTNTLGDNWPISEGQAGHATRVALPLTAAVLRVTGFHNLRRTCPLVCCKNAGHNGETTSRVKIYHPKNGCVTPPGGERCVRNLLASQIPRRRCKLIRSKSVDRRDQPSQKCTTPELTCDTAGGGWVGWRFGGGGALRTQ